MAIHERVLDFQVSVLRNDVVDYHRVVRLTTTSGSTVFLAFPLDRHGTGECPSDVVVVRSLNELPALLGIDRGQAG